MELRELYFKKKLIMSKLKSINLQIKGGKMKHLLLTLFLLTPALLFSQDKNADTKLDITKEPVLSVQTNLFKMKNLQFSKLLRDEKGETLETQFQIENLTNISMDFYIFVIATYEKESPIETSFDKINTEDKNPIKLIKTYPDDLPNYEYTVKDITGSDKKVYQKYPKNIKAGVNKDTGKPYTLNDVVTFHSFHVSPFIKKYHFFNEVTILIFDSDEKLVFRQNYSIRPVRR